MVTVRSARILIWAGSKLQPHENRLEQMQAFKGISLAGGCLLFWSSGNLVQHFNRQQTMKEFESNNPIFDTYANLMEYEEDNTTPVICRGCQHYHGKKYDGNTLNGGFYSHYSVFFLTRNFVGII